MTGSSGADPPPWLSTLPSLPDTISRYDLMPRRGWGQHFLLDQNLCSKIARAAGDLKSCSVIEVGSGPGGLTRALLAQGAKHVTAIEIDPRALAVMQEIRAAVGDEKLTVTHQDALTAQFSHLPPPRVIVSNLPYNIATPLIFRWLRRVADFDSITILIQKEVAQRILSPVGNKIYDPLSVLAQWLTKPVKIFDIGPQAFFPPPKVTSTLIKMEPRLEAPVKLKNYNNMRKILETAFAQRRKMIRQSLRPLMRDPRPWIKAAELLGTERAESLSVADFERLLHHMTS